MRRGRFAIAFLVGLWSLPGFAQGQSPAPINELPLGKAPTTPAQSLLEVTPDARIEDTIVLPEAFRTGLDQDASRVKIQMRGRIQTDAIMAVQSAQSKALIGNLQNGYGFRRARIGMQGTVGDAAHWVSEIEVAGGTVRLRDMFLGVKAFPSVNDFRLGYFREPFSLEGATSSNFITFMERSPLNSLDPTRNWGLAGYWWPENERMLGAMGLFRTDTNSGGQSTGDEPNWALTGRLTGLPIYEPDDSAFQLMHLGAAISFRRPPNGVATLNPGFQSNLLTVSDDPASPFLPSVPIPSNSLQLYNLQAARVFGPLSIQSEWFAISIQQINAGVVFGHGFYVDASYFLTGEHRGYDRTRGAFDTVNVLRPVIKELPLFGRGALELAARYSYVNYNSPNLPLTDQGLSPGAVLHQVTLGTNWYLNSNTRLMFNYTLGVSSVDDKSTAVASLFSLRGDIHW